MKADQAERAVQPAQRPAGAETTSPGAVPASGVKEKTITFNMVKEADGRCGVECSACGDRFFDLKSKGVRPRLLTSCIELAVAHAKEKHESLRSEVPSGVCRGKRGKPDASH